MTDQADLFDSATREIPLAEALGERYLAYALSTITARSLPDVRDGLKPVHRRLLFAMRQLRLDPDAGFKKCARVVGDVMGKFHPHGDQAIYDAMVRMAQDFAVRYPMVEGQGNFGNIDGDGAAAMRYTEARLTRYALALLEGIDEDAVDFRANYDGTDDEPAVLPGAVPNLLCNGASGIAVGMATSIPPHNLGEVCDAALHLIDDPETPNAALVELVPGPDFPTGGVLAEPRSAIEEAYATGRGSLRLRARWEVEKLSHGQYQVVVTEIPYQTQKARLIERIAGLIVERKLPSLVDVRDESAEDLRLVLEPRTRTVDADAMMAQLFRLTELETRVSVNMNVLDGGRVPVVMNLRQMLRAFLDHRHDILCRRTRHRLDKIAARLEVLAGYLIAFANLDEIIRIVREDDDPKAAMMARWEMSEVQAEAILNMRLRALRRLEEAEIAREHKSLKSEQRELNRLLNTESLRWERIAGEIRDVRARFGADGEGGARRTRIADTPIPAEATDDAAVEREPITVICSQKGWIRAVRGHQEDAAGLKFKDGDRSRFVLHAHSTDRLLAFGTNGRFYTIPCDRLPNGRGHGEPVRLMVELGNDQDLVRLLVHEPGAKLVVAASDGRGFVVPEDAVVAQTRAGKQVLNLAPGAEAQACARAAGDSVAAVGSNRKLLIFPLSELPEMTRGRGVIMQRYAEGGLSDIAVFHRAQGLAWRSGQRTRRETVLEPWAGKRGQAGRVVPRGFPRSNRFSLDEP
ncbi:MAG: DNA topoisomerase IV subunit A [Defluviicoccus sp.]|nr:DNA topoisomerase IV subunit A [Defluviicoccus sp.]